MKKIIALISALLIIISLAACSANPKPGEVEPSPIEKAQGEIISSFGFTKENIRIVAYEGTNDYVKYIVAVYNDGKRADERTHYFYTHDVAFEAGSAELKNATDVEIDPEKRYISYKTYVAVSGDYKTDLEIIKQEYTVR